MKIERQNRGPDSDRSWSVETDLDTWVGKVIWLMAIVLALVLLRLLGIEPPHFLDLR
jgi:hypothetical protein